MPETKDLLVEFPIQGCVRRFSYANQPPTSTPNALNIRPESVAQLRYRGGSRPGLSKTFAQVLGSGARINALEWVSWVNSTTHVLDHQLVAASNGTLYKDVAGTLTSVASGALGTSYTQGVDIGQKLYFADWSGTGGTVKVFDPSANTIGALSATAGTPPTYCKLVSKFRGRLVLAGDRADPHIWYMSRVGDPTDWDYSIEDDTAVAVSGALSEAFKVGEAITAIIPSSDMCLLFGCTNSLWLLRGDPAYGGQIDNLSNTVGVLDAGAWCKTPENIVVFMTYDGLYMTFAGCDDKARPQSLSRERIPEELLNIDISTTQVLLEYDTFSRGVHIFLSPKSGSTAASHWYFDWENKGFWPITLPGAMQPSSIRAARAVGSDQSTVYLGCLDGYVRNFDTDAADDDGTSFESYLDLGPIGMGQGFRNNCIDMITGAPGSGSGDIHWHLRAGHSPQDAFERDYLSTQHTRKGVWYAGQSPKRSHPRLTGSDFFIRLRHPENQWTVERVGVTLSERGMAR